MMIIITILNNANLKILKQTALNATHDINKLLSEFERGWLKIHVSGTVGQHEPKICVIVSKNILFIYSFIFIFFIYWALTNMNNMAFGI